MFFLFHQGDEVKKKLVHQMVVLKILSFVCVQLLRFFASILRQLKVLAAELCVDWLMPVNNPLFQHRFH